ncbi:MAG: helix-turn-helix domain-containing protein [Micromonosporaceae bacterium]
MTGRVSRSVGRGPTDRGRLARALAEARRSAGIAGADAGRRAGMSQSKVSKVERGFLLPTVDDVRKLCQAYAVGEELREELLALAADLRAEASARVILARGVAEMQRRIALLESSATTIRSFQPAMIIGLLQTPAYAQCVFSSARDTDAAAADRDSKADAVTARLDRQVVLRDQSKQFILIMTEGALRWHACSAVLMAEQIEAIVEASRLPNVAIGLIPWTTPVRLFPRHGFHLYDDDATVVGTETATATITGHADVLTYLELFRALEDVAVFDDHAREHFGRIAKEYRQLGS